MKVVLFKMHIRYDVMSLVSKTIRAPNNGIGSF